MMLKLPDPVLMRGGIVYGELFAFGDITYGPGLTNAYLLEEKSAKYPRIIMTGDIVERAFKETTPNCQQILSKLLNRDFDAFYMLNYFGLLPANGDNSVIVLSNESEGGDFLMHYFLENKTGHDIMFSMDAVSVNGYMADPFWGASVAAGKKLYATACFYESLLTDNGIESVEGVEFTMRVSNAKNWDTHASEVFTYIP